MTPPQVEKEEPAARPLRWKTITGGRLLEIGMLASATGLAVALLLLLLLGKLDVMSSAALLRYGTLLVNLGTAAFMICAAGRLVTWTSKK